MVFALELRRNEFKNKSDFFINVWALRGSDGACEGSNGSLKGSDGALGSSEGALRC